MAEIVAVVRLYFVSSSFKVIGFIMWLFRCFMIVMYVLFGGAPSFDN